ncbi:MAG: DUF6009 family protein [Planctomycetota bacterium]
MSKPPKRGRCGHETAGPDEVNVMKMRIRFLDKGGREVIRLLAPEDLEGFSYDDPLMFEKSIVWLEDVESFPFVRVKMVRTARSRRGPISFSKGVRVVGYARVTRDAPRYPKTNGYIRRVFYLKADDLAQPGAFIPDSAYDPKSIVPGEKGQRLWEPEAGPGGAHCGRQRPGGQGNSV